MSETAAPPPAPIDTQPAAPPTDAAVPEEVLPNVEELTAGLIPVINRIMASLQGLADQLLSDEGIVQIAIIAAAGLLAWLISRPIRHLIERVWPTTGGNEPFLPVALQAVKRLVLPMLWVALLWTGTATLTQLGTSNDLLRIVASLLNAWIVIRLFSTFVRDPLWSKVFATVAWIIAALNILRLLNPVVGILDSAAVSMGEARISLYMVIKGIILLIMLVWFASLITQFVQARVSRSQRLTPSVQTLISQAIRLFLLFAAIMLAMNAIGVDLTALAVFSGAVGVGIGFGLQAIFSNLVAGIIMLLERSIKVGDFVELESGLTAEVREINIRATRVTTGDNADILVPNSEFINNRVTNWTLHEGFRRMRIPFGVAYGTDKELVRKAALEAASSVPHMLKGRSAREPQVWLTGFGDSSLDFELVVWLAPEAVKRPAAVNADYNWALETALGKYGIEIPFPQRDLNIRTGELPIRLIEEKKPRQKKS